MASFLLTTSNTFKKSKRNAIHAEVSVSIAQAIFQQEFKSEINPNILQKKRLFIKPLLGNHSSHQRRQACFGVSEAMMGCPRRSCLSMVDRDSTSDVDDAAEAEAEAEEGWGGGFF